MTGGDPERPNGTKAERVKSKPKDDMKGDDSEILSPDGLLKEIGELGTCGPLKINESTGSWYFDFKPNDGVNPDGVEYRFIVPASKYRRQMVVKSNWFGSTTEYHFRSAEDLKAERKEVSVVLLTRNDPHVVTPEESAPIKEYISRYAMKGVKQGIEIEHWIKDYRDLDPRTKDLVIESSYTYMVKGMTEAFRLMREHSLDAVATIEELEGQVALLLKGFYQEAREKGFAIDWSGFMPGVATPGIDPHRTFEFAKDAPRVPEDVGVGFKYIESLNRMLSELTVSYVDTLLKRADDPKDKPHQVIKSTLTKIAHKFDYSGLEAARNMIRDFGWNMWQTRGFHYSISLPQDHNGLVSGALVKSEGNLHVRYSHLLAALNFTGDMAWGVRTTIENDEGKEVPQLSTRYTINKTLPTSNPPQATAPGRTQFGVQSEVCFNGGANHFDRSGGEVVLVVDGKRIVVGPIHSIYRPRVTTSVDTFKDFLNRRKEHSAKGPDAVRGVHLSTPVRFEDTSADATPELFRANLFRISLQHILHQAALIATSEGETDIYAWLEKSGVLKGVTAKGLYDYHTTDQGLQSQMEAVRGKLGTQKLNELSRLVTLLKGKMSMYLEEGKTIEQVPHLQQVFDYAEKGIETLKNVEKELNSNRKEFDKQREEIREAYATRPDNLKRDRRHHQKSPAAIFYRWYCRNPRIAAYSNLLTNSEIATILLDVFELKDKVKIELPDGTAVEFQLDDKIWELWYEGENYFDKRDENRAVLLTLLYHYHAEREKERVREEREG